MATISLKQPACANVLWQISHLSPLHQGESDNVVSDNVVTSGQPVRMFYGKYDTCDPLRQ